MKLENDGQPGPAGGVKGLAGVQAEIEPGGGRDAVPARRPRPAPQPVVGRAGHRPVAPLLGQQFLKQVVRSAVALGILLNQGVGDTLRISLTGDPVEEVRVGLEILKSLNLISRGVTLISCPTCGRTEVDLIPIVERVEEQLMGIDKVLTVAIMGCVVNGPGEAREADIGVACGKKSAVLFEKGRVIKKVAEGDIVDELVQRVRSWKDNHLQRDAGS